MCWATDWPDGRCVACMFPFSVTAGLTFAKYVSLFSFSGSFRLFRRHIFGRFAKMPCIKQKCNERVVQLNACVSVSLRMKTYHEPNETNSIISIKIFVFNFPYDRSPLIKCTLSANAAQRSGFFLVSFWFPYVDSGSSSVLVKLLLFSSTMRRRPLWMQLMTHLQFIMERRNLGCFTVALLYHCWRRFYVIICTRCTKCTSTLGWK